MAVTESWAEVISRLRRENAELAAENTRLRAENGRLLSENGRLAAENVELRREIDELKRLLAEGLGRVAALERENARQAAPFRRREELKVAQPEKKKPGRPPGHEGARRSRPPQIDHEVDVPLTACPQCGGAVGDRRPLTQYIEEIPPLRPKVTRLTTWQGRCPQCGEVHSTHPLQTSYAQGAAEVQLGPRAAALATLLNKHLGLTMRKTCSVLKQGFGLSLSAGGLAQLLHRAAGKVRLQYQLLQEQIRHSPAVYADETSWYVGDPHAWLWVFTTPQYTLYHVDSSRGGPVAEKILGKDFSGVLVTDCFAGYLRFKCPQHKCIAHHLRALKQARDKPKTTDPTYLDAWRDVWKEVLELRQARDDLPAATFTERRAALESKIKDLLLCDVTQPGDVAFRTRMQRVGEHRLGCLYYDVEATNNRAERAIRPAVIARKVSCGNKTERGAVTWQILVSLAATACQNGRDFLTELSTLLLAPPVPAG